MGSSRTGAALLALGTFLGGARPAAGVVLQDTRPFRPFKRPFQRIKHVAADAAQAAADAAEIIMGSPNDDFQDSLTMELDGCTGVDCLERYVGFDDGRFSWRKNSEHSQGPVHVHVLHMVSQRWAVRETRKPQWKHEIRICVPDSLGIESEEAGWGVLFINDMHDEDGCDWAGRSGIITIGVANVPLKDIDWADDGTHNTDEEYVKAYSRRMAVDNPERPEFMIEAPSLKAVVKAMDVVEDFFRKTRFKRLQQLKVDKFIVVGASKRGAVAWEVCALDKRVKGIVPQIIKLRYGRAGTAPRPGSRDYGRVRSLAMQDSTPYANLSSALLDPYDELVAPQSNLSTAVRRLTASGSGFGNVYDDLGLLDISTADMRRIFSIIDAYWYMERLDCGPKLVQNVGMDIWFSPDSSRTYLSDVPDAYFQMYGSRIHSVVPDFTNGFEAFIFNVIHGLPQPKIDWTIDLETGDIDVRQVSDHTPTSVRVWRGVTPFRTRPPPNSGLPEWHFRNSDLRKASWTVEDLGPRRRSWRVLNKAQESPDSYVECYVEFKYAAPAEDWAPVLLTTEVSVMPNDVVIESLSQNGMIEQVNGRWQYVSPGGL